MLIIEGTAGWPADRLEGLLLAAVPGVNGYRLSVIHMLEHPARIVEPSRRIQREKTSMIDDVDDAGCRMR